MSLNPLPLSFYDAYVKYTGTTCGDSYLHVLYILVFYQPILNDIYYNCYKHLFLSIRWIYC